VRRPYPDTLERLAAALGLVADERAHFLAAGRAAPRSPAGQPGGVASGTLPLSLTTFIGRSQELADLVDRPQPAGRLAAEQIGAAESVIATDVIAQLPLALRPDVSVE